MILELRKGALSLGDDGRAFLNHLEDGEYSSLGSILDEENCPEGMEKDWAFLRGEWLDALAFGEACYREAISSYASGKEGPWMR